MDRIAIERQVDRILRSRALASKPQLRSLLGILVAHYDTQATLQPARVIGEVWDGKPARDSADLASAMSRLRHALEAYYAKEGAADEILIRLPKRGSEEDAGDRSRRWIIAEWRAEPVAAPVVEAAAQHAPAAEAVRAQPGWRRWRTAAMVGAAALLCALLSAAVLRMRAGDRLPSTARLDGNTLVVVDAKGKEVWTRSFPDGFWGETYAEGLAPRMWFGDLDGSGRTSVLLLYNPAVDGQARSTALICFSERGEEKWRWSAGRVLPELGSEPSIWDSTGLAVLHAQPGKPARIVVVSRHYPQYPEQVALIDPNGKTISEYWHSGHLDNMALADLDQDGRQEIVLLGVSNGYNQATLVVLDPDRMNGASLETARPELQIHGMGIAHERFRALFPRSDINLASERYNRGWELSMGNGIIRAAVEESERYPGCLQWYEFDTKLNLRNVYENDKFRDAHEEFFRAAGHHPFTAKDELAFWKVRCIAGCAAGYVPVVASQAGQ